MHPDQHQQQYEAFLTLLRDARIQADLTQQELAVRVGWTQSFVSKCERGERRIDVIDLLAYLEGVGFPASNFVNNLVDALVSASAAPAVTVTAGSKTQRRMVRT